MPLININKRGVTVFDVPTSITDAAIIAFLKIYGSKKRPKIDRGDPYQKGGVLRQRIYITFQHAEDADEFMKHDHFRLDKNPVRVERTLSPSLVLYDRSVTGLQITIQPSIQKDGTLRKLTQLELINHFSRDGKIECCQWTKPDETEALFTYASYDTVDKIILENSSPTIKGVQVHLQKVWSDKDFMIRRQTYVVHVTYLPLSITSETVSELLQVPIVRIVLYPLFQSQASHLVNLNRPKLSEAWIHGFTDEDSAKDFAKESMKRLRSKGNIKCDAMLEEIDQQELCEQFAKGRCPYFDECHYKHFTCNNPDDCDDESCWYGHSIHRTTQSINRQQPRLEEARYRIRFSNLPPNISREALGERLQIKAKDFHLLVLQPSEQNNQSTRTVAYLRRQLLHNKLRHLIDQWHGTPFSANMPEPIQCQLELDQDFFEWHDLPDTSDLVSDSQYTSPAPSVKSFHSAVNRGNTQPSSIASDRSYQHKRPNRSQATEALALSKHLMQRPVTTRQSVPTTNELRSQSKTGNPPTIHDLEEFLEQNEWQCTNDMISKEQNEQDECFWLNTPPSRESYTIVKIYSPQGMDSTLKRAQYELNALRRVKIPNSIPSVIESNVDALSSDRSPKLWTIMGPILGEKLSTYAKQHPCDLRIALNITHEILRLVKQIHAKNVIHRDLQPKNVLIRRSREQSKKFSIMLINFSSAWTSTESTSTADNSLEILPYNGFYYMPQFSPEENKPDMKAACCSPRIDATGVCAILFWLITRNLPLESRDINQLAPHEKNVNWSLIEKKVKDVTAFDPDGKTKPVSECLKSIFDRAFADDYQQQWTVDELESKLQETRHLLAVNNNYEDQPRNTMY